MIGEGEWLDETSGELRFQDLTLVVRPDLRLADFERHFDRARFAPFVSRPPHRSFRCASRLDDTPFICVLFFDDQRITTVDLVIHDPEISGTSWEDYEPERVRRFHDQWLERRLGRGTHRNRSSYPYGGLDYRYPWGEIGSSLNPQDQNASISLIYRG
jgi:hypothetical protein